MKHAHCGGELKKVRKKYLCEKCGAVIDPGQPDRHQRVLAQQTGERWTVGAQQTPPKPTLDELDKKVRRRWKWEP